MSVTFDTSYDQIGSVTRRSDQVLLFCRKLDVPIGIRLGSKHGFGTSDSVLVVERNLQGRLWVSGSRGLGSQLPFSGSKASSLSSVDRVLVTKGQHFA